MDWTGFVKHGFVKYGFGNKCFVNLFLEEIFHTLGPSYMVSGTRDNPSPELTLSSVYMCENVVPVGRVKLNPA